MYTLIRKSLAKIISFSEGRAPPYFRAKAILFEQELRHFNLVLPTTYLLDLDACSVGWMVGPTKIVGICRFAECESTEEKNRQMLKAKYVILIKR